jgi:RNA polymerase sigma factor (sigma-70 family)
MGCGGAKPNSKRSILERQELIEGNRDLAQRMSRAILRTFNARLDPEELISATDIALCEAASRYRPMKNATFSTYLYYFLKGALVRSIKQQTREVIESCCTEEELCLHDETSTQQEQESISPRAQSPEAQTYKEELRLLCQRGLAELTQVERSVLLESHVMELGMQEVADNLGYSRGHLFSIRKTAENKFRSYLLASEEDFDLAA